MNINYLKLEKKRDCNGCRACINICPRKCIKMKYDCEGFWYPVIDKNLCINCGKCKNVCHKVIKKEEFNSIAFACKNNDEQVRKESSSGGIFSLLSEIILDQNGIVFGAAFNADFEVEHIAIDKKEDLWKIRGSKYVQSNIKETYSLVKYYLEEGREVLFSGTPCQVNGLKSFLNKDYNNLVCVDFICMGVPSPLVWEKHVTCLQKTHRSKIQSVQFRNKDHGWKDFGFKIEFSNKVLYLSKNKDIYLKSFLEGIMLRPSCYKCQFRDIERISDFTLGDCWGIDKRIPLMNDNKGMSVVLLHSKKATIIWDRILTRIQYKQIPIHYVTSDNSSIVISNRVPRIRKILMNNLENSNLKNALIKSKVQYIIEKFWRRISD